MGAEDGHHYEANVPLLCIAYAKLRKPSQSAILFSRYKAESCLPDLSLYRSTTQAICQWGSVTLCWPSQGFSVWLPVANTISGVPCIPCGSRNPQPPWSEPSVPLPRDRLRHNRPCPDPLPARQRDRHGTQGARGRASIELGQASPHNRL